jgi:hypothetical protein
LDLSADSPPVVRAATELAVKNNAKLIILFAYRLIPKDEEIANYRKVIEQKANEEFAQLEKELKDNPTVNYEFRTEIGFLTDRIEALTQKEAVSALVIGRSLASSIYDHKRLTLQQFIDSSKFPVLIVPEANE